MSLTPDREAEIREWANRPAVIGMIPYGLELLADLDATRKRLTAEQAARKIAESTLAEANAIGEALVCAVARLTEERDRLLHETERTIKALANTDDLMVAVNACQPGMGDLALSVRQRAEQAEATLARLTEQRDIYEADSEQWEQAFDTQFATLAAIRTYCDTRFTRQDDYTMGCEDTCRKVLALLNAPPVPAEARTCETCRFAGNIAPSQTKRRCHYLSDGPANEPLDRANFFVCVPLTVNGRPFRCEGWTAKPETT